MKLLVAPAALLLALALTLPVFADGPVPLSQSTAPPATAVPADTPPPAATPQPSAPTAIPDSTQPITVAREHSTPVVQINQQTGSGPQSQSTATGIDTGPNSGTSSNNPSGPVPSSTLKHLTGTSGSSPVSSSPVQASVTLPPDFTAASPAAAASPAQLVCTGKPKPAAAPFLSSPYAGWTEIVSFVDHDRPDYEVDGKMVLGNGLIATASEGAASDAFPSYWSPALRQYINYDGHNGYDFDISYQPILAAADGTVSFAGWNSSDPYAGYGQMILINHQSGYVTLYGHLSQLEVKKGDRVRAGQEIGISGTTGHSSGPHLHFSVFHNCQVTDPYGWSGRGTDPLKAFDGETATYLWLPGRDPLLLNPPPNWPEFPGGLHLAAPAGSSGSRQIPSADRLLLLHLPVSAGSTVNMSVALARTEAVVGAEAESLTASLDSLARQGVVQSYQLVPSAAAIWVRGTASAAQLESLPGVASLAGVQARDLSAAEQGFAHAVLIQTGAQHAPSLWPLGFRSALTPWRPAVTVLENSGLVAGFGLPGATLNVSLWRNGQARATASTISDSQTGGFVAVLQDPSGAETDTRPGDVVTVQVGGRESHILVQPLLIKARSLSVAGLSSTNAVSLDLLDGTRSHRSLAVERAGRFLLHEAHSLPAGTLGVASISDSAGNRESSYSFVPGLVVRQGSAIVMGWAAGNEPLLSVARAGKVLLLEPLHPGFGGTFQTDLIRAGKQLPLRPGDVITIGSSRHRRTIVLPRLSSRLSRSHQSLRLQGPANASISIAISRGSGSIVRRLRLDPQGRSSVAVGSSLHPGESVLLSYTTRAGDSIEAITEARRFIVREHTAEIAGTTRPGALVVIRARDRHNQALGEAIVGSDETTGSFEALLRDAGGRPLAIQSGMRLVVSEDGVPLRVIVPNLALSMSGHDLRIKLPLRARGLIEGSTGGKRLLRKFLGPLGRGRAVLGMKGRALPQNLVLSVNSGEFRFELTRQAKPSLGHCGSARSSLPCSKTAKRGQ